MTEPAPIRPRAPADPATIGVFALSGTVDAPRLEAGVRRLQAAGHRVVVAPETYASWRYFAGTDGERLAGFARLLDDPAIDVMLCARGGYGLSRLLGTIDWARVGASGKVFAGFSDFTAFSCAALARAGFATLHGPMVAIDFGGEEADAFTWEHFRATVWGTQDAVTVACDPAPRPEALAGTLWGGNLSLVAHLAGTPYLPPIEGGLLYLEEIAEEPYAIERLFLQLHHAGILRRQKAVLLGDFCDCTPRNENRYPYSMGEAVESLRAFAPCPVLTGLPFGHVARKLTLPFGLEGRLVRDAAGYTLSWPGFGSR